MKRFVAFALVLLFHAPFATADDWPQWRGPHRDGRWRESGVVDAIPAEGLPIVWRQPVAWGYAGPAVADGRVFVHDFVVTDGELVNNPGGRERLEGSERVLCLSAKTGAEIWRHEYDCPYNVSYPGGPRCTPTVDGDRVYTLGTEGHLICFSAATGEVIWSKNFAEDFDAETPHWGHSAHPLVAGELLYCLVGGKGSVVVAFDKNDGSVVWQALTASEPGYAPPDMIQHAGTEQLLIWHPESVNGLDPTSGEVYWSVPLKPAYGMSTVTPQKSGNWLFASGHGQVGAMMRLGEGPSDIEVVWGNNSKLGMYCANSTPLMTDTMIYGCDIASGALVAARIEDGQQLWTTHEPTTGDRRAAHGTAFLVQQGEQVWLFSETGDLVLARLSPEKYEELGRFHVLEPTNECFGRSVVWSHPAFANRRAFVRNDSEIVCVDLAE